MKVRLLNVFICLLPVILILMAFDIYFRLNYEPVCFRIHVGEEQLWGSVDVVPDEETAMAIANIVVSKQTFYHSNTNYEISVTFQDNDNIWEVEYKPVSFKDRDDPVLFAGGVIYAYIRKDSGMVTHIWVAP